MNSYALKAVTWGTVAAALLSALVLAQADASRPDTETGWNPASGWQSPRYAVDAKVQPRTGSTAGARSQTGVSTGDSH